MSEECLNTIFKNICSKNLDCIIVDKVNSINNLKCRVKTISLIEKCIQILNNPCISIPKYTVVGKDVSFNDVTAKIEESRISYPIIQKSSAGQCSDKR